MEITGSERKKNIITFLVLLLATASLIFLLLSSLSGNNERVAVSASGDHNLALISEHKQLAADNFLLQAGLNQVALHDKEFITAIIESNSPKATQLIALIRQLEGDFSHIVDSVNKVGSKLIDAGVKDSFAKMILLFRSQLDSRQALSGMRNALLINRDGFTPDEKTVLKLQDDLTIKNNKLAIAESALRTAVLEKNEALKYKGGTDVRSQALVQTVSTLENKLTALTATNNALRQDNERLARLQADGATIAKSSSNELFLKEKIVAQQQKIEALNAEMQLLRVDCNLNRVDATQIISTAKQRKLLLTEASTILTALNSTGNEDIRKKVRDKVNRLNSVAANSRD